MVAEHSVY